MDDRDINSKPDQDVDSTVPVLVLENYLSEKISIDNHYTEKFGIHHYLSQDSVMEAYNFRFDVLSFIVKWFYIKEKINWSV